METSLSRRRILGIAGGAGALLAGGVALTLDPPRVVSVASEFGEIRDRTADVETRIVVENPNSVGLPGAHTIGYDVALNDVGVATGVERGVRLGPGRTVVGTTATFDNTAIPEWWPTHVNGDEESTIETRARFEPAGLPFGISLPPERTELTTDFLGSLGGSEPGTVTLGDRELLVVGDQRATWGEADTERAPVRFRTEMENVHDRPVGIDGTDYEIRMNDVVVGSGETEESIELAPGESGAFTVEAAIDTPRMQEWWVSHLRNGERTDLVILVYPVTVEADGTRTRLPVTVFEERSTFETDMLGTGETVIEPSETEPQAAFSEPTVTGTRSEWGEVRDSETDIETTVTLRNDTDEAFDEVLALEIEQETAIAGIPVATGTDTVDSLPQGEGRIDLLATKDHATVPRWWAAHLENGERSVSRTDVTAEADVAVTTLPLDLEDRETTVETDLLADLDDDSRRTVTGSSRVRPLFVVHATRGEWVDPTPAEGSIRVEADMENDSPETLTIREIDVSLDINGVVLTDERLPETYEFGPGERRTVVFRIPVDNARMEAWWPTHIRNGEASELTRSVAATIAGATTRERTTLDFLSGVVDFETDLLGE